MLNKLSFIVSAWSRLSGFVRFPLFLYWAITSLPTRPGQSAGSHARTAQRICVAISVRQNRSSQHSLMLCNIRYTFATNVMGYKISFNQVRMYVCVCLCMYIKWTNIKGQWCLHLPGISALDCQSQFPQGPNTAIHHKSVWPEKEQPGAGGEKSNLANH